MPKLSVYAPTELLKRMEGVKTNWSAVAQRAFERELIRIATMMNDGDVVARLQASQAEYQDDEEERGKAKGADWARQAASWRELKRLEKYYDLSCRENIAIDLGSFAQEVLKIDGEELQEFNQAWLDEDGDDPAPELVEAFMEGAIEVWNEVSHKV